NRAELDGLVEVGDGAIRFLQISVGIAAIAKVRPSARALIDHLDSTSSFGLYFSIHSSRLKTLGMRAKQRGRGKPFAIASSYSSGRRGRVQGRPRISASASLARVKFTMTENVASARFSRNMPGKRPSGTTAT